MSSALPNASPEPYATVFVAGAGAWGTALAIIAATPKSKTLGASKVKLWARKAEMVASIASLRQNTRFLPDVKLPEAVEPVADIKKADDADAVLVAAPAQHLRGVLQQLKGVLKPGTPTVLCAKGIELKTGLLLTEVLAEILPEAEPAMLSGPSFAHDVALGLPTAVTIAAREAVAARLLATLARPGFRPYLSDDIVGVALGGAAKNVYAIAAGMVEGAGLGESARAATISRSFAELLRFSVALGAKRETLMGLSGLGDLVLTATSISSRNFALGLELGKGVGPSALTSPGRPLAEGAATAPALVARAGRHGIELPIAEAVADVLQGALDVRGAVERLLSRPFRTEG